MLVLFNKETNKGKTYITQRENLENLYTDKASSFNVWFQSCYIDLIHYLKDRNSFNEDIFTDTYLKVYDNILNRGTDIKNKKGFFLSAYFRVAMNDIKYQSRYQELPSYIEIESIDNKDFDELEKQNNILVGQIFEYVYSRYSLKDYEIFKIYINLQPAINYKGLAKITGLKYWYIQKLISRIIKDLRANRVKIESKEAYSMETNIEKIELDQSYSFSTDYEALWDLRLQSCHTIICTVNINNIEYIANMTPNGEIFDSGNCYSDFEGVSKSKFLKECEAIKVKYITPYTTDVRGNKKTKRTKKSKEL